MSIKIERAAEREFSVFDLEKNKFMNLDYTFNLGFETDPKPYINELPEKGFTYEECERFIIHQQGDKKQYLIQNIKQPYFLLDFHLNINKDEYNKEAEKQQAEQRRLKEQKEKQQAEETKAKQNLKSAFVLDVKSWNEKVNSKEVQFNGKFSEVSKQKPQMKNYNLTIDDFNQEEINSFIMKYNLL